MDDSDDTDGEQIPRMTETTGNDMVFKKDTVLEDHSKEYMSKNKSADTDDNDLVHAAQELKVAEDSEISSISGDVTGIILTVSSSSDVSTSLEKTPEHQPSMTSADRETNVDEHIKSSISAKTEAEVEQVIDHNEAVDETLDAYALATGTNSHQDEELVGEFHVAPCVTEFQDASLNTQQIIDSSVEIISVEPNPIKGLSSAAPEPHEVSSDRSETSSSQASSRASETYDHAKPNIPDSIAPPPTHEKSSTSLLSPPPPPPVSEIAVKKSAKDMSKPVLAQANSTCRTISHNRLRAYEATRRSAYETKLKSSSLYWRSFRALIANSLYETRRAEQIIKAGAVADSFYANHMKGCFDDMLDEETALPITDEKKRRAVLKERAKVELQNSGTDPLEHATISSSSPNNAKASSGGIPKKGFKLHAANHSFLDSASNERRGAMLTTLIESQGIIAERFEEHSALVLKDIVPELSSLSRQLDAEVKVVEALGDAILKELAEAEHTVVEAWEKYFEIAVKSLSSGSKIGKKRDGAADSLEQIEPTEDSVDVWLVEMHYRMSVAFLAACWDKASIELSRLFTSMKETECQRRFRLRELLISALQKKERLFVGLPSVLTPVLQDLVNRPMDSANIEDDVQTSIRLRAQSIQRSEMAVTKSKPEGLGLAGVDLDSGKFELTSPLTSDLLCKAKVIEKKASGMMGGWKIALAVVTADSFLHLFDVPSNMKVGSGSAPEVAFHALLPPVQIPTEQTIKSHTVPSPRSWSDLTPALSIVLSNSCVSYSDAGKNTAFEITETYFNEGANKIFGKTSTRKIQLRTISQDETRDWVAVLKARK